ncbi:MAG: hypothetical protein EGS53_00195 [Prevotella sp.]|nr:hypothetical protein [Prevotella sp.]
MKINLFTSDGRNWFENIIPSYPDIEFHENDFDESQEWDVVAVYEDLVHEVKVKTKKLILISGEPPLAYYTPKKYLKQFDAVITGNTMLHHPNIIHWQQSLPTHIGRSWSQKKNLLGYNDLLNIKKPEDLKVISLMASNYNKLPGHRKRIKMVDSVIKAKLPVDIFGKGRKFVDDKKDAILPYMFHVCIENAAIDDYWTEKIADSIICNTVPIYYGCTNIEKYFDPRCMFIVHDEQELIDTIRKVLKKPDKYYADKKIYLETERRKLFNSYNIIGTLLKNTIVSDNCRTIVLNPKRSVLLYGFYCKCLNFYLKMIKLFS